MKNAFIKMYSTLGTIVLNVQYNTPECLVQLSPTLDLLFRKRSSSLYLSSLISLHHPKAVIIVMMIIDFILGTDVLPL